MSLPTSSTQSTVIRTPDQRLRVFISSTLQELAEERKAARLAIEDLRLSPVLFELGARPHAPADLYRAYLDQSHIFVGIYWQRYGWVAPDMTISGLEDEYNLSGERPKLIYIKQPAPDREPRLNELLDRIRDDDRVSYKPFATAADLRDLIENDLALLLTERFEAGRQEDSPTSIESRMPPPSPPLPLPPTRLIGREAELEQLRTLLLQDEASLVTLTGSGGAGKTRLALQAAHEFTQHFPGGVFFVPLASITDPLLVLPGIAHALSLPESAQHSFLKIIQERLCPHRALLVLDNFEQVVQAAPYIAQLLEGCPQLQVLVTSRTPLRVRGEREMSVPPLALPDRSHLPKLRQLSQYAAVQLFIQRASDVKPGFQVNNETAPAVAEICHRLDGLPLAIELAAARIKILSPQALLHRLEHSLEILTSGARDLPARQQTLRNAIGWSYELLDENTQVLFRRLGVFAGGCTYEAAEAVANADQMLGYEVFDELEALADNSLLQVREINGELRFYLLETIREFALEKLAASGEAALPWQALAAFCLQLAEQADPALLGPAQPQWLARLELERPNFGAAFEWCLTADHDTGLKLAAALYRYWEARSYILEGSARLEEFLALTTEPTIPRGRALNSAGALRDYRGDYATARRYFEEALAIFRAHADQRRIAAALNNLALASSFQSDFVTARQLLEESLVIKRALGEIGPIANALNNLSQSSMYQHDYEAELRYAQEALDLFQQVNDPIGIALALGNVGDARLHLGQYAAAHAPLADSLRILQEVGEKDGIADCLERFGSLNVYQAQPWRAAQLFSAASALRQEIGTLAVPPDRVEIEEHVALARSQLGALEFEQAWASGQALTLEAAIVSALESAAQTR